MKIALYSDLHLEHSEWKPPTLDVDVVVLAGDIGVGITGIEWAAKVFRRSEPRPTVLYVPGNHEYYGNDFDSVKDMLSSAGKRLGIKILDNATLRIGGVRFLGTTLWSDFRSYENEFWAERRRLYRGSYWTERSTQTAATAISDYAHIRASGRRFQPVDTIRLHADAAGWLASELAKPFEGKTVIVTHFAPHRACASSTHYGNVLTPYFVVDMASLMSSYKIDLWMFGHTHHNVDVVAENWCRVVSNQRGYPHEWESPVSGFQPELVIEI